MTADAQKIETLEIPDIHYQGKPILIKPDRPTPNHSLYLSNLDDQKFLRFSIKYLYAYEKAVCVNTLKDSLSKVLSEYYPLAGRLKISEEDEQKFSVDCNGEGAVFAEAFMDSYSVYDLLELCKKPNKSFRKLLFKIDAHTFLDVPPLVVQVTYLRYGGMIISTAINHCLCDGIGTSQFLNDWAYMTAKPDSSLPVTPFHTRHHLKPRCPPINLTTQPPPTFTKSTPSHQGNQVTINNISQFLQSQGLVATSITFEPSHILHLKSQCSPSLKCTTFEALASHTWRAWVRALNLSHWLNVKLLFSINIRKKMKPVLTQGYYGNGFVLGCAETNVRDLVTKNLHHGVKVVQNAKSMVDDEYVRSVIDLLEDKSIKTDMSLSLIISQWSKFGLEDVDFGEGKPLHMGPLTSDVYCLFLPVPGNFDAIRVLVSLPQSMASKFEFHMTDGIWDSVENVDQAN